MILLNLNFIRELLAYCSTYPMLNICFAEYLIKSLQKIQQLIRLCFKNKLQDSLSLIPLSREAFNLTINTLGLLKNGCCNSYKEIAWKCAGIYEFYVLFFIKYYNYVLM